MPFPQLDAIIKDLERLTAEDAASLLASLDAEPDDSPWDAQYWVIRDRPPYQV